MIEIRQTKKWSLQGRDYLIGSGLAVASDVFSIVLKTVKAGSLNFAFTPSLLSPVDSFGGVSFNPKKGEILIRSSKMIGRVPTEGVAVSSDSTVLNLLNKN